MSNHHWGMCTLLVLLSYKIQVHAHLVVMYLLHKHWTYYFWYIQHEIPFFSRKVKALKTKGLRLSNDQINGNVQGAGNQ